MVKVNDDILIVGGIIGGAAGLILSTLANHRLTTKTSPTQQPKNFIHGADGIGAMWVGQKRMDGFISSFYLSRINKSHLRGNLDFSAAYTDGIYEEDDPKTSAEIIMMMPPYGKTIDVTEGAGIAEFTSRRITPNFDWENAGPGFYCTVSGMPVYKFSIPIRVNRTYTKRVIAYENKTEYALSDNSGNYEVWYDMSGTNKFRHESTKTFSKAVEYHIPIPCIDAEKKSVTYLMLTSHHSLLIYIIYPL